MALKIKGLDATLSTFREVDRRFKEAAAREIEEGAKAIAARARMYAPVDQGDLERSIRALRVKDGSAYRWRVKVGGMQGGRDVTEYAWAAHEGFSTNRKLKGPYGLGKKSKEKQERLGVRVGRGYLRRAFLELQTEIQNRVRLALRGELNEISRRRKR